MLPLHFLQSKKYLKLWFYDEKYEILGTTPSLGRRTKFFGITADLYVCEKEPEIVPAKGLHIVSWHVPKNKDIYENIKKPGWYGPLGKYLPTGSPIPYIDTSNKEYYKLWSKKKRRYQKKWLEQINKNKISVAETEIDIFSYHYLNSFLPKAVKEYNIKEMIKLKSIYNNDIKFYLVTNTANNSIIAGMCYIRDHDLNQIINQYSFVDKTYPYLGTGMMDFRIKVAQKEKLKYVNWGKINTFGIYSKSCEGLTRFKLLFNPIVLYFRQSYFRIMWNR